MSELLAKIAAWAAETWNDPVWSKVIAAVILAVFGSVGIIFNWWKAGLRRLLRFIGVRIQSLPNIRRVNVEIPPLDLERNPTYPIKCYVTLQNASTECAEVRVSEYRERTVTLKRFVFDVLQLDFRGRWFPQPDGVDRIAVLPQQLFRAWVGIDETKFNRDQVNQLRGQIGTLALMVDGKSVDIDL
jgi:hypothetical protein